MFKEFEEPIMEMIEIMGTDVIVTSGGSECNQDGCSNDDYDDECGFDYT